MVSAVILAAGMSTRMGENKLLLNLGNKTVLEHVVDGALTSRVEEVIVVTGAAHHEIKGILKNRQVKIVQNQQYRNGQSTSLKVGIEHCSKKTDGYLFLLGDQPFITAKIIDHLIDVFINIDKSIVVPVYEGARGNPVLFDKKWYHKMLSLEGDIGARRIIKGNTQCVYEVEIVTDAILRDIDTMDDYQKYCREVNR